MESQPLDFINIEKVLLQDDWAEVCIGSETVLLNEKPCARCGLITIDHQRKELRANREPFITLLKYVLLHSLVLYTKVCIAAFISAVY